MRSIFKLKKHFQSAEFRNYIFERLLIQEELDAFDLMNISVHNDLIKPKIHIYIYIIFLTKVFNNRVCWLIKLIENLLNTFINP